MGNFNITDADIDDILSEFIGEKKSGSRKKTLTAAEAANLWSQYMGDTEAICIYTYLLKIVEDKEIRSVLEQSVQLSQNHIAKTKEFFTQAGYPIPVGFSVEKDVNLQAPRLYSDAFILYFIEIMTVHGFTAYSLAIGSSEREDIRNYFIQCESAAAELYNKIINLSKSRGQFYESPVIPSPDQVEFLQKKGLLSDLFGDPKPLSVVEINNLFFNMKKTILSKTTALSFSQVAESAEIRQFFLKTTGIAEENLESLRHFLTQDDLPSPPTWEDHITKSTVSPFSDKLMMFHIGFKMSSAIAYYGAGIGTSMRADILAAYSKTLANVMKSSNDWLSLMVKNGWLERPPEAVDRKSLAKREH
ncbi:DUF3231 family protein [Ammoniphilus sp. 3BR4]|uniref:DUF3231 family protein n=1 Tax=Ammoniphilus sp. 3BR4 TaxID=3158265 RepID=UPI003465CFEE